MKKLGKNVSQGIDDEEKNIAKCAEQERIRALRICPKRFPYEVIINKNLPGLEEAIGGGIEAVYPFDDPVAVIVHAEGKLIGLELNRALRNDGAIYDVVAGDFLIVGYRKGYFCSLSPNLMKKYRSLFYQPEMFFYVNGTIVALPLPDDMVEFPGGQSSHC